MRQPSARVREAVIAVLLAHPAYAQAIPAALAQLSASEQLALRFFYNASVLLQRQYADCCAPTSQSGGNGCQTCFHKNWGSQCKAHRKNAWPGWASRIVRPLDLQSTGPARMTIELFLNN